MAQRIIFSMDFYEGRVYNGLEGSESPVESKMDWCIMDQHALLSHIRRLMGEPPCEDPNIVQQGTYYGIVGRQLAKRPDSALSKSFALSAEGTVAQLNEIRTTLAAYGYKFDTYGISERIDLLNDIEAEFQQNPHFYGYFKKFYETIEWVESQAPDAFSDYEIAITTSVDTIHPIFARLLKGLEAHGARLSELEPAPDNALSELAVPGETWSENSADHKVHFLHFRDKCDADQYLAIYGDALPNPWGPPAAPSLWITPDADGADSWLGFYERLHVGSDVKGANEFFVQFLKLALGIHREPLDIQCLLDWLQMPASPLDLEDDEFRTTLTDTIVRTGGFRNNECLKVISDFIESAKDDDSRSMAESVVSTFLPSFEPAEASGGMPKQKLLDLTCRLSAWATEKADKLDAQPGQFHIAREMRSVHDFADRYMVLATAIDDSADGEISWPTIDSWLDGEVYYIPIKPFDPGVGCRTTITSSSCIAAPSDLTVWTDLTPEEPYYDRYLTADEKEKLSKKVRIYTDDEYADEWDRQMLQPLKMSKRVIIVYYDLDYGQPVDKHPLLLKFEALLGDKMRCLTTEPTIADQDLRTVQRVDNSDNGHTLNIADPASLTWPETLSYSDIDMVINHPVDFVAERMLGIMAQPHTETTDVLSAQSVVAHTVISAICRPRDDDEATTPSQIAERLDQEYEDMFLLAIEGYGAVLGRREHRHDVVLMSRRLLQSLKSLCEVMRLNHLEVTACGKEVSTTLALLDENANEDDVHGSIDMVLRDTADGSSVIFDLKWTSHPDSYRSRLLENRSIQLALYRQILTNVEHKKVSRAAYFVMPEGKLLSHEKFEGDVCELIEPYTNKGADVVRQIVNSFHYRKRQLETGVVELGEGKYYSELAYVADTEAQNLLPLADRADKERYKLVKEENRHSQIKALRR